MRTLTFYPLPLDTKIEDFLTYKKADRSAYQKDYKILAAEIEALGSLLQSNKPNHRKQIHGFDKDRTCKDGMQYGQVLQKLLRVLSRKTADPILLTAICNFASELFECDDIVDSRDKMEKFAM